MAVEKSIERNADCFYLLGESLGFTNILQHSHIHTNDNVSIQDNTDFPSCKEEIDRQVKDLLDQNIIKPESSYFSLDCPKKGPIRTATNGWRMVLNFRS